MKKFTVIIPHYTKSDTKLLERAVLSIPDTEDIQVLVIDNSPIKIKKDLFSYRENIQILFSDNSKGAGHARNIGLKQAVGKWLLFLDADDFFIENAFDIVDKFIDTESDIVFFKMTSKYSDTLEEAHRHIPYEMMINQYFRDKDEYKLRCEYASPCAKMVRLSFVKENNIYYDEVPASNDVMFALKIGLLAKEIDVSNHYIYCATVEKGSLTNTISLQNIESRFDVNIRKNKMLKDYGYKRSTSVMLHIVSSVKYGFRPFFRLLFKALITGNLFVGYNRWFKTVLKNKNEKNKSYIIKE